MPAICFNINIINHHLVYDNTQSEQVCKGNANFEKGPVSVRVDTEHKKVEQNTL